MDSYDYFVGFLIDNTRGVSFSFRSINPVLLSACLNFDFRAILQSRLLTLNLSKLMRDFYNPILTLPSASAQKINISVLKTI